MPSRTARPRRAAALASAAALFAAAALAFGAADAAARATIALDPGCYLSNEQGSLLGTGFKPDTTWTAKLAGTRQIGSGRTDGKGRIRARFTAPIYKGTNGTKELSLSVTDGPNVASTTFVMSPLTAGFSPQSGNPATLRVRWRVLGMGAHRGVYVHYIRPNGKLKKTLRIGTTDDVCGALKTGAIALFPFKYEFGLWTFQVDTSSRYAVTTKPRVSIAFQVRRPASRRRSRRRG
ncbi:hypothetical protein Q5424_19335 [Conexibacter sp. JD483]|uniref:hypothetical protein n=1 Tax=unclassified Conexibacter TaxID=2627773 RepID=UPI002717A5CB|nr:MULTISPECIES: hypothetical protein [unclassified Conexibacter]MDO8187040.1 hypothetical protein [Conexibacter sp. CPCC 205706]MDO8200642.1 hypothetical protein [Conexibacter sp. CPCC 205762]MDR9371260.1 hypothetical protein [Conexibacter sp. JD483]